MGSSFKLPKIAIVGALVILLGTAACLWWVFRDTDVVLFNGLDEAQLNAVSADLDRAGIPHHVNRESKAVTVAPDRLPQARLAILSSGNAFRESTGFELFNNSDFGMTEFAQRINYQRAMEGELARTLSALGEIRYARVHLVLPEHGLFRAQKQQPRAAVTVFPEPGQTLTRAQVRGVQRLTASAVPELEEKNVSVMDETGVILSTPESDDEAAPTGARLAQKQAVERYLSDKVRNVLTQALGAERFAVSVDATLELNQRTTTTERVIETPGASGIRRIKESSHGGKGDASPDEKSREVEYDLGREVEQIVHGAGGIRRVQVGVIIDRDIDAVNVEALRDVISSAVGADVSRGDRVTVIQHGVAVQRAIESLQQPPAVVPAPEVAKPVLERSVLQRNGPVMLWLLAALVAIAGAGMWTVRRNAERNRQLRHQELRRRLSVWAESDPVDLAQS